jgi:hypothetical protein
MPRQVIASCNIRNPSIVLSAALPMRNNTICQPRGAAAPQECSADVACTVPNH